MGTGAGGWRDRSEGEKGRFCRLGDLAVPLLGMKADRTLIELVAAHHMLATLPVVRAAGLTEHQWERLVRNDVWVPLAPGVWHHEATPVTWEMQVRAGSWWLGERAALHGATALRWWGVEVAATPRAEFLVPRSRRHVPPWLTLHTTLVWARSDLLRKDGVRVSSVARAIVDHARTATARELEAVIDEAVRRRLTSVPTLTARMRALEGRGRNGIVLLRELLLDSGGESFLERRFLQLMRQRGLPRPLTQVNTRPRSGTVIRVDFLFPGTSVVVEVSGRRGHSSDADRQKDARRRNTLLGQGMTVLEFTTADVIADPDYVVAEVVHHLAARPSPASGHRVIGPPAKRR